MKSFLPDPRSSRAARAVWLTFAACMLAGAFGSVALADDKMLEITTRNEDGQTHFYVQNRSVGNVTITLNARLVNMDPSEELPYTVVIPGKQTVDAFTLTPSRSEAAWNYTYTYACNHGSAAAKHDERQVYELPYAPGSSFRVVQGHHGTFSHTGQDEYAIDWKMPEGTAVLAARDGLVVKSKDDSNKGGPDRKFEKFANCIMVQHADGTIGVYLHLQKGGNKVKAGDQVKAGDVIGLSGNTGFSSGSHLHFAVFKMKSGSERISIPVKFRTAESEAEIPVSGHAYMAVKAPELVAEGGARTGQSGN